MLNPYGD